MTSVELVDRHSDHAAKGMAAPLRERVRLLWALLADDDEEEEDFDLDALLGDGDLLSDLMEELRTISPGAGEVLIDERDTYIAEKVRRLEGEGKTLAVGAGHLKGIAAHLDADRSSDMD